MAKRPKFRRVLLKLSGEALGPSAACGGVPGGIDIDRVRRISREIASVHRAGVQLGVVIGAGNILRGNAIADTCTNPATADTMGMLATVINGLALQDVLAGIKVNARLQTAIPMQGVAEPYIRQRCIKHLEAGRVVILAGGTGSPFFTTDTAAALRAREIDAGVLLKATNVDGVYSDDPKTNPEATRYRQLTYEQVLRQNLRVMDATAITLCREAGLPVIVFNLASAGNIRRAVFGQSIGTTIRGK